VSETNRVWAAAVNGKMIGGQCRGGASDVALLGGVLRWVWLLHQTSSLCVACSLIGLFATVL
jgi:hypothetical protein